MLNDLAEAMKALDGKKKWRCGLDQPDIVWPLLEEECQAGFIEKVPGGLQQLQGEFPQTVVADTKTGGGLNSIRCQQNISIPNRMLLPRITDVLQAAPEMASSMELEAFTLDISKAH